MEFQVNDLKIHNEAVLWTLVVLHGVIEVRKRSPRRLSSHALACESIGNKIASWVSMEAFSAYQVGHGKGWSNMHTPAEPLLRVADILSMTSSGDVRDAFVQIC
jgi:hypothetical protein